VTDGRRSEVARLQVVLFSRPGCHLCEEAAALLRSLAGEYGFGVTEQDIESSIDLVRRYAWTIPVVRFDDDLELHAPIDERQLRTAIRARMARGT
jgi:hypothetical protein